MLETAIEHGTGALWIDGGRIETSDVVRRANNVTIGGNGIYGGGKPAVTGALPGQGRWPANFGLVCDCDGDDHDAGCPVRVIGEQSGVSVSSEGTSLNKTSIGGNGIYEGGAEWAYSYFGDKGTAARYFYHAKASRSEREAGLDGRNPHPTVKPLAVAEYMARLMLPPAEYRDDAVLLVPYSGVGSEMIGAWQAGWRRVEGCELEAEYIDIAKARIAHWCKEPMQEAIEWR